MRLIMATAAIALLAGTPARASATPVKSTHAVVVKKSSPSMKAPDFDPAQMMAIFDKIFPPQPDPLPARLALSKTTVTGLFPDGTYARMMDGMMHGLIDRVMGLSEADFVKADKGKPADSMTLRQKLAKDDPYFEERMTITQRVIGEELLKFAAIIEPKIREGLARSMARRFDEKQLTDINAFLATDTGREFGRQSMAMYVDPDVMRAMMSSFPEMMKAMPGAMQRVEAATAQLPKPKKLPASDTKK
jgi:hypothetical protein